jgi:hypothetical protein
MDSGKLPNKPEINPRKEVKAITSRDEVGSSEFLDIQEVKEALTSGTSYQGPTILTNSEEENTRRELDEHLVNLEVPVVKEVPYENELERAEPISSISLALKSEPARTSMNADESDPHMTRVHIIQSMCTNSNSSKKKKGTETQ